MNYRPRLLERRLLRLAMYFPVVLLTGARQVGKTTLVKHAFGDQSEYVVFDPVLDIFGAREDPEFFLDQHPPPVILDEVQYAPEVLPAIKRRVDANPGPGQYILTGSQNLALMRQVAESLTGRTAIVDLEPMTVGERAGRGGQTGWLQRWLENPDGLVESPAASVTTEPLLDALWRGGFPGLLDVDNETVPDFFRSYIRTYVERDVRLIADVRSQVEFGRFLGLCAALTAQEVNHSQLGRDVGTTPQTAQRWLDALGATFVWAEIPAYTGNAVKRLSKKRKGFLVDTGLAAHLQRLSSPRSLEVSLLLGPLFETMVVSEVRRQAAAMATAPMLYHWRSHGGAEVDLVLELDGTFWPVEAKSTANISRRHERGFRALRDTYSHLSFGQNLIVAPVPEVYRLSPDTVVVPWDLR